MKSKNAGRSRSSCRRRCREKTKIEAKNQADSLIFTAEKTLKDAGDKAPADLKKEVEDKSQALKDILETGTKEDLEAKSKDLMDSLQKVGAEMYKQTPPPTEEKPEDKKEDKKPKKGKLSTRPPGKNAGRQNAAPRRFFQSQLSTFYRLFQNPRQQITNSYVR